MKENEKNLFYNVLSSQIAEEAPPELMTNIMQNIHKIVKKRTIKYKILVILGYAALVIIPVAFVGFYLYYYTNFKIPSFQFNVEIPSKNYLIVIFILFVISLVELFFRKRLYENN
jgi:uncharacterized membrane protein